MKSTLGLSDFPQLLQHFFCNRLMNQQNASKQTIVSYRDTFRLLLEFIESIHGRKPSSVTFDIISTDTIISFLNYLEKDRNNSIRTRNNRLAAIKSFMKYVSYQKPELLSTIGQITAIPLKRHNRPLVGFLSVDEMNAILNTPIQLSGVEDVIIICSLHYTIQVLVFQKSFL